MASKTNRVQRRREVIQFVKDYPVESFAAALSCISLVVAVLAVFFPG